MLHENEKEFSYKSAVEHYTALLIKQLSKAEIDNFIAFLKRNADRINVIATKKELFEALMDDEKFDEAKIILEELTKALGHNDNYIIRMTALLEMFADHVEGEVDDFKTKIADFLNAKKEQLLIDVKPLKLHENEKEAAIIGKLELIEELLKLIEND